MDDGIVVIRSRETRLRIRKRESEEDSGMRRRRDEFD